MVKVQTNFSLIELWRSNFTQLLKISTNLGKTCSSIFIIGFHANLYGPARVKLIRSYLPFHQVSFIKVFENVVWAKLVQ